MGRKKKSEAGASVLIVARKDRLDNALMNKCGDKKKKDRNIYLLAKCHPDQGVIIVRGGRSVDMRCGKCGVAMFTLMVKEQPKSILCSDHPGDGVKLSYNGPHLKVFCMTCKKIVCSIDPAE